MATTEESVRRSARVLTAFMSAAEAEGFATSFVLDPGSFKAAWSTNAANRPSLTPGYRPPRIEQLEPETVAHTTQLFANPLFAANYGPTAELKMVELGRLIAMQHWVDCDVSDGVHGTTIRPQPDIIALVEKCLPLDLTPAAKTEWQRTATGLIVYTLDNSFGLKGLQVDAASNVVQLVLATNANLMLVREFAGRYVLANGYHRAWMLRSRKVEMVPVVVVRVPTEADLVPPGFIAPQHLLGQRPPLVDDFFDDALSVTTEVRAMVTAVKVTIEELRVPRLV